MGLIYMCSKCRNITEDMPLNNRCPVCGYEWIETIDDNRIIANEHHMTTIKISKNDVIESMRNGCIWFQSPKYFQTYKGDGSQAITDISECAYDYVFNLTKEQAHNISPVKIGEKLIADGKEFIVKDFISGKQFIPDGRMNAYRLLCFYNLKFDQTYNIIPPDSKLEKFGDCFSTINIDKLLTKTQDYFNNQNIDCFLKTVRYQNMDGYQGIYNPTFKDLQKFSYQNEYRLLLTSENFLNLGENEPFIFSVPNLNFKDCISQAYPIQILFESRTLQEFIDMTKAYDKSRCL